MQTEMIAQYPHRRPAAALTGVGRVRQWSAALTERYADQAPEDCPEAEQLEQVAWDLAERGFEADTADDALVRALLWPDQTQAPARQDHNALTELLADMDPSARTVRLLTWPEEGVTGFEHVCLLPEGEDPPGAATEWVLLADDLDLAAIMAGAGWHPRAQDPTGTPWIPLETDDVEHMYAVFTRGPRAGYVAPLEGAR